MSKRNSQAGKAARRAARARKRAVPPSGPGTSDPELPAVLEVRLHRMEGEDADGAFVSWAAEWAFQGADVAVEETSDDLGQLVAGVADDVRTWAGVARLSVEWEIGGDAPPGKTVEDMIAAAGVSLPSALWGSAGERSGPDFRGG